MDAMHDIDHADPEQDLIDSLKSVETATAEATTHFQQVITGTEAFNPSKLAILVGHMGLHMTLLTEKVVELRVQMRQLANSK